MPVKEREDGLWIDGAPFEVAHQAADLAGVEDRDFGARHPGRRLHARHVPDHEIMALSLLERLSQ